MYTRSFNGYHPLTIVSLCVVSLCVVVGADALHAQRWSAPVRVGTISDSRVRELSGMVRVTDREDYFWIHNDSDDAARIFAIHQSGIVIAEVAVAGASAIDWEDIARGPGPIAGREHLYIADTGNNDGSREELQIYRIPEPELTSLAQGQRLRSATAEVIRFRYPDGPRNNEALVVQPGVGDIYLITKVSGTAGVYRVPDPRPGGAVQTLSRIGSVTPGDLVTAADVSADGRRLLVRTYSQIQLYELPESASFDRIFFQPRRLLPDAPGELKSESICFDHRELDYLTTNEGNPAPVHRAHQSVPQPHCPADESVGEAVAFVRGDADGGSSPADRIGLADALHVLDTVLDGRGAICADRMDADDDGAVTPEDAVAILEALVEGTSLGKPYPDPGLDPTADALGCLESVRESLVEIGSEWAYWSSPGPPGDGWNEADFDDASWRRGDAPLGMGQSGIATVIDDMRGSHMTLFARREFELGAPGELDGGWLGIDYNDAFVAYLNGVEIARAGVGEAGYETRSSMPGRFHSGGRLEELLVCLESLRPGRNVLAVELHNRSLADSTLFLDASLHGFRVDEEPRPSESPGLETAVVSLEADSAVNLGDPARVRLSADASAPFRAFGAVVSYDSSHLRMSRVSPGEGLRAAEWFEYDVDARAGLVTVAAVASLVDAGDAFPAGDGPIDVAELHFTAIASESGETTLGFARTSGVTPFETTLLDVSGRVLTLEPRGVDLELTDLGLPLIQDVVNGRGRPGHRFFVIGIHFFDFPELEVLVCGRATEFTPLGDGFTIEVVAPECELPGFASVEVRNEAGSSVSPAGFFYTTAGLARFVRGDVNGDDRVDISDAIAMLGELFTGAVLDPACPGARDANGDGVFDISDAIRVLTFLFQGGETTIPPPFPEPGLCEE